MHNGLGDLPQAQAELEKAVSAFRALGDAAGELDALAVLAWVLMYRGEHASAQRVTEELLEFTSEWPADLRPLLASAMGDECPVAPAEALRYLGFFERHG